MAKFCTRCGTPLDADTALCPSCDREKLEALKNPPRKFKFCTQCGTPLNAETGICPNCTPAPVVPVAPHVEVAPVAAPAVAVEESPVVSETPVEPVVEEVAVAVEEPAVEEVPAAPEMPVEPIVEAPPVVMQQPVVAPPAFIPELAPVQVEYKKKRSSVGKVLLTILLSIILFVTTLLSVAVICVRHTTSASTITAVLEDVNYADLLNGIYTEPNVDPEADYGDESWTFVDYLSDYFKENVDGADKDFSIDDKQVDTFVKESGIEEFMSDKIAAYMSDIYDGTEEFEITKAEVRKLLKDNREVINKTFEVNVSNEVLDELADWLVDDEVLEGISTELIKDETPAVYYTMHIGLSYFTLIILLLMVVLCLVGLCFNSLSQAGVGSGVVFTMIGGILTVAVLVFAGLPAVLESIMGDAAISAIIGKVLFANLGIFVILFLLGVTILIVRSIICRIVAKRRARKVA